MRYRLHRLYVLCVVVAAPLVAACASVNTAAIIELDVTPPSAPTREIIFVTPTPQPTLIPTFAQATATTQASATPIPTNTPDVRQQQASCAATLNQLYTDATEFCIGEPAGFLCNGGLPPRAEPSGLVGSALAQRGALVETGVVDAIQTAPMLAGNSGGLLWMRLYDTLNWGGLMLGDVAVRDVTPEGGTFDKWQSLVVVTTPHQTGCNSAPISIFVMQATYGQRARIVVNGVSLDLTGTLGVQTEPGETHFIALEGISEITIFGQTYSLFAGQQLRVPYAPDDFTRPLGGALPEEPLAYEDVTNLPITLLDRPVLLPQPGFVQSRGNVNVRAADGERARLLFQVPDGELLSVLGQNPEQTWYHVRVGNGETGWMRADLVDAQLGAIRDTYDQTPAPPQRFGDAGTSAQVVARGGGNLRTAPHIAFPIMRTLEEGTNVELIARSPYSPWVKVDTGVDIGWMALITIETDAIISFLPQDFEAPLPPQPTSTPYLAFGGGHAYPDPRGGQ